MIGNGRRFEDKFSRFKLKKWEFSVDVLGFEIFISLLLLGEDFKRYLNVSEISNDHGGLGEEVSDAVRVKFHLVK